MRLPFRQPLSRRFAWPATIAAATLAGLVSGLLGDGAADVAAAIGLAIPALVGTAGLIRASRA